MSNGPNQTDERGSQVEHALLGLRSLVLGGAFEANGRISEVATAERLGVSRTPLRQAMDRMVGEGLLIRNETGGVRVASFTVADIVDAIELRGVIEGAASRLAAERGAETSALEAVEQIISGIDHALERPRGMDFDTYVALNARFHSQIAALSGSAIMQREVERVYQLPFASPSSFLQEQEMIPDFRQSLLVAQSPHRAILDAIRNREGARAEALSREHARLARLNLEHVMRGDPAWIDRFPGLALVSTG